MKKYFAGLFSGLFACIALGIGGIYFSKNDRLKNYAFRAIKTPANALSLSYHLRASIKNLESPTEFEKAAAINDYLYQYLIIKDSNGSHAGEILRNKQGLCRAHAYCMVALLKKAGIECQQAFIHGIPTLGSHELVQVYFSNGEIGLFDPTFGIYWKSPHTGKLLSLEELMLTPSLAMEGMQQSSHKKNGQIEPFFRSSDIYQHSPHAIRETSYETLITEAKRGGLYSKSQSEFIFLHFEKPMLVGSKEDCSLLASYQNENQEHISGLTRLGVDEEVNWSHIYQLSNLKPNTLYILTLYFWEARNTLLSAFLSGGSLNGYKERTHHISIHPESSELTIQIVPESEEALLFLDNRDGLLLLNAIEWTDASLQSKSD